jgi:hypothetical protein
MLPERDDDIGTEHRNEIGDLGTGQFVEGRGECEWQLQPNASKGPAMSGKAGGRSTAKRQFTPHYRSAHAKELSNSMSGTSMFPESIVLGNSLNRGWASMSFCGLSSALRSEPRQPTSPWQPRKAGLMLVNSIIASAPSQAQEFQPYHGFSLDHFAAGAPGPDIAA